MPRWQVVGEGGVWGLRHGHHACSGRVRHQAWEWRLHTTPVRTVPVMHRASLRIRRRTTPAQSLALPSVYGRLRWRRALGRHVADHGRVQHACRPGQRRRGGTERRQVPGQVQLTRITMRAVMRRHGLCRVVLCCDEGRPEGRAVQGSGGLLGLGPDAASNAESTS